MMAANTVLDGNTITNNNTKTCVIVGSNAGYGQSTDSIIRNNTIHGCGSPANGNQDHGIYVENSTRLKIEDNIFYNNAGWAVHLYPNAQNTLVAHNVIDNNGRGIIFAGDNTHASNNNTVTHNTITNSTVEYNVQSWWAGPTGQNNTLTNNCLFNGKQGNTSGTGYTATNNTVANPNYANPAAHNYTFATPAPCLTTVGYDTALKLGGTPPLPEPQPLPQPNPELPTVTIDQPEPEHQFKSYLWIAATADDNTKITKVIFRIDNQTVATDATAPFQTAQWVTGKTGQRTITATAYDTDGNTTTQTVTVTRTT